nr:hypothetical protein [Tanacetum cinerariifolium]
MVGLLIRRRKRSVWKNLNQNRTKRTCNQKIAQQKYDIIAGPERREEPF